MQLPEQVGVMVLPQTVFFPHHLLPLHIFEPRYRTMLQAALEGSRMFAVAMDRAPQSSEASPAKVAGLGLIRSSIMQPDGTSSVVLQGLARVRLDHRLQTQPYLIASPEPVEDPAPPDPKDVVCQALVTKILEKVEQLKLPAGPSFADMKSFLRHLEDHHAFVDLLAGCIIVQPSTRQKILETAALPDRLRLLLKSLSNL